MAEFLPPGYIRLTCFPVAQELSAKQYWEELLAVVTYWMVRERAATTGTASFLRQVETAKLMLQNAGLHDMLGSSIRAACSATAHALEAWLCHL